MSSKILQEIRKQISAREKELTALVQAANLLSATAAGRGRKVLIKSNFWGRENLPFLLAIIKWP